MAEELGCGTLFHVWNCYGIGPLFVAQNFKQIRGPIWGLG